MEEQVSGVLAKKETEVKTNFFTIDAFVDGYTILLFAAL